MYCSIASRVLYVEVDSSKNQRLDGTLLAIEHCLQEWSVSLRVH